MVSAFGDYSGELLSSGRTPLCTTDFTALEQSARKRLDEAVFEYVCRGAGTGATVTANRRAFDNWRILPRVLRDATVRQWECELLGTIMPAPVLLAPVGMQTAIHPDGELATARAAGALGVPMVAATMSSHTIEEIAEANGDGPRWFQLQWPDDPDVCASFLRRAEKAGFSTLVVSVDSWLPGWRPHDLDRAYLPSRQGEGTANYYSDPVFRSGLVVDPETDPESARRRWASMVTGTDHSWDNLPFLREHWAGPLVLKGIQHPDDARRAVEAGVEGIVVSNHGGRQIDGAVAALDALPAVVQAVGDGANVLFDSGIRTGADAVKALALGAEAVLLGRPYLYGLAHGGQAGVDHVLRGFLADLDLTMALSGYRVAEELTPDSLVRAHLASA